MKDEEESRMILSTSPARGRGFDLGAIAAGVNPESAS